MFWHVEFWRPLVAWWPSRGGDQVRRVIVLVLEGLEPELVDDYLEQGLLHHLALLGDVGTRAALAESRLDVVESVARAAAAQRLRSVFLPSIPIVGTVDLPSICAADLDQQERLIAALSRRRPQVVTAVFDMPQRLAGLFGPNPRADEQLILRDVYARMDEVVGKAFSFADATTVLLTAVPGRATSEHRYMPGFLSASRPLRLRGDAQPSVAQLVSELFGSATLDV